MQPSDTLRPEIAHSWWRSELSGLSPEAPNLRVEPEGVDRRSRLGNSIATAHELRRGVAVHGEEHYLEPFKRFSCYGHPISHPVTRRLVGVLDITCDPGNDSPLLAPLIARAARDIEERLLHPRAAPNSGCWRPSRRRQPGATAPCSYSARAWPDLLPGHPHPGPAQPVRRGRRRLHRVGRLPDRRRRERPRDPDPPDGHRPPARARGVVHCKGPRRRPPPHHRRSRPEGLERGWFLQPTGFADVDNSSVIAQEEIFGPVLSLILYDDVDHAVRFANDSEFGLGGTVWTSDPERGAAVAHRVRTGTIGVNRYIPDPAAPFGGVKASGLGRELGPEGLAGYQQTQTVYP